MGERREPKVTPPYPPMLMALWWAVGPFTGRGTGGVGMGHDHWEQGHFWGGVWLLKVRLGLWAQPRRAPRSGEGRGGPEEEKSGGAGKKSKW